MKTHSFQEREESMRIIGLDIHRVFAEAVALEGAEFTRLGRIGMTREHLAAFAATLKKTDHVIVEATGNATALVEILTPYVARVAVANPLQVYLIAKAKTKTDKIDARVLAQLYACRRYGCRTRPHWRDGARSHAGASSSNSGSA